ncbi:MAG: hypothetical protein KDC05_03280 [Bacteroidales bacterium]|nr:hypothetical protein [Bacteroidales bacterium]
MNDQYYILISKLDRFIRKYYKNLLIRGAIYGIALLLAFFLIINLAEYFGNFNSGVRTGLVIAFGTITIFVLVRFIFIPVSKLIRIGKRISHEQAASIIGKHFPEVSDKLLNTLQLKKLSDEQKQKSDLLEAGISQKINELKPVPFQSAIDFRINTKYLKYPVIPLLILAGIIVVAPAMITEPSNRLVNYSSHFEKPLPYKISIQNDKLEAIQNDDFILKVELEGEEFPANVIVQTENNNSLKPVKESNARLNFRFVNVQDDISFNILTDQYKSETYRLKVLPEPVILDFDISLDYPAYTGKKDETINNNGDLMIPEGTLVSWRFAARNTDIINLIFPERTESISQNKAAFYTYEDRFYKSAEYTIKSANKYLENRDSLNYTLQVIPDLYPVIVVDEYQDSIYDTRLYFKGTVKDDYGFNLLTFNVLNNNKDTRYADTLAMTRGVNPQQYYHYFDLTSLDLDPGDMIEYYFEVWDNDGVNGSKSTRSQFMSYEVPTLREIEESKEQSNEEIKDKLDETMKEVKELQKDIDKVSKELIDKKELNWEDKEQVKQLLEKQKNLQQKMEQIKEENIEKSLKEQQYKQIDEQILEKQKKLEELFENLMQDEEFKELFEKIEEMMEQMDKEEINKMLDEMKFSNEELEEMLDRNLELFKQLEFEQKLDETIDKLNELAEKQEKLSEETADKNKENSDLLEEQQKLKEEFEQLKDDLEKLDEMNQELEESNEFDKMEQQQEEVSEEMQNSEENLQQNKEKKASQSQKKASEKMQQMAQQLEQMQQQMIEQGMGEDIGALRDILENLIQISFDQENLMDRVGEVNINDPQYTGLIQEQNNLADDLDMVKDSLTALAKRNIMIEPFISKEVNDINSNIEKSIDFLNNRRPKEAASRQQFVMTSVNNLALMLSETLNQMMQAMSMQSKGGSCKNPGQSKPGGGEKSSIKSLRQLQEQLNQQMEQMKSGQQQMGKQKDGQKNSNGQGMSEQLARTAAQQEYIRNELRKLADQMEKEGNFGNSKELKQLMQEMEKTETDVVNKMITNETLMRQKNILTRLLKSEKAEMEREKEEKRESSEAKNQPNRNPDEIFKYKKVRFNEVELLETVPPSLKPFYKNKVNQYFFNFEELLEQ